MTAARTAPTGTASAVRLRPEQTLIRLGWGRWRVLDRDGAPAGLVEEYESGRGTRFRALRYRWSTRAFLPVGDFWSLDDAIAVLRNA
ncbi:MAG: hypothetical protein K0R60_1082 [Microbacterium sp.]|jgi:hypothetical protein|nr:hypothetical protein [Microbacterium sp.]